MLRSLHFRQDVGVLALEVMAVMLKKDRLHPFTQGGGEGPQGSPPAEAEGTQ